MSKGDDPTPFEMTLYRITKGFGILAAGMLLGRVACNRDVSRSWYVPDDISSMFIDTPNEETYRDLLLEALWAQYPNRRGQIPKMVIYRGRMMRFEDFVNMQARG